MEYMDDEYKRKANILYERTSLNSETGCWEWIGTLDNGGYGAVTIDGTRYGTHVLSAILFHGYRLGMLLQVLHKPECKSKACCNPDHLYVGTAKDNAQDRVAAGTQKNQHRDKTHCKHGHEFTPENTRLYTQKNGVVVRVCKACKREKASPMLYFKKDA